MNQKNRILLITAFSLLSVTLACSRNGSYVVLVTATPFSIQSDDTGGVGGGDFPVTIDVPSTPLPPDSAPTPTFIPTPDPTRDGAIDPNEQHTYIVQVGDTLGIIAQRYGVSTEQLMEENNY